MSVKTWFKKWFGKTETEISTDWQLVDIDYTKFRNSHPTLVPVSLLGKRKLGRKSPVFPSAIKSLATYFKTAFPAPPSTYPVIKFGYSMLGNGPDPHVTVEGPNFEGVGNCTICAMIHLRRANELETDTAKNDLPTANQAVTEYFVETGGQDTGLVVSDVLKKWYSPGTFNNQNKGYASFPVNDVNMLKIVITNFGGAYLGVNLPAPAETQTENGQPWALTNTPQDQNILGGHAIPAIAYDLQYVYVVTWGLIQAVTWEWLANYLEEAWAVITTEDARVDLVALQADLANV